MPVSAADVAKIDDLAVRLRDWEAKLDSMPPGTDGRKDVMRTVFNLRGVWRQAETAIGRRAAGMTMFQDGVPISHLPDEEMMPIVGEIKDLKRLAVRHTGNPVSGEVARVAQKWADVGKQLDATREKRRRLANAQRIIQLNQAS